MIKTPVRGMRDILPPDMELRSYVLGVIQRHAAQAGFTQIETPALEHRENLTSRIGGDNEKLIFEVLKRGASLEAGLTELYDEAINATAGSDPFADEADTPTAGDDPFTNEADTTFARHGDDPNTVSTSRLARAKELLSDSALRYDLTVSNNSNVALENFYLHDRFPTDCSTVKTVTTGTYNTRLNYQITYKTNYNDYRVLATNLLSTNIYAFDLAAVPLMQGEVITDVRLEFGKVPAGFASVVKPTVTIQTSGTLANGYQVVNRADAGGQYMSQWETGRTAWITLIIRLNQPTLPKTGY